jgi:hypothetical protein
VHVAPPVADVLAWPFLVKGIYAPLGLRRSPGEYPRCRPTQDNSESGLSTTRRRAGHSKLWAADPLSSPSRSRGNWNTCSPACPMYSTSPQRS